MGHINSTTINTDWKRGKHLNFEDRCSIKVFRKLKYSMRRIADELNCSPSTIMYELRRGRVNVMELVGASLNTQPDMVRTNTKPIAHVAISILVLQRITLLLFGLSV